MKNMGNVIIIGAGDIGSTVARAIVDRDHIEEIIQVPEKQEDSRLRKYLYVNHNIDFMEVLPDHYKTGKEKRRIKRKLKRNKL